MLIARFDHRRANYKIVSARTRATLALSATGGKHYENRKRRVGEKELGNARYPKGVNRRTDRQPILHKRSIKNPQNSNNLGDGEIKL